MLKTSKFGRLQKKSSAANLKITFKRQVAMQEEEIEATEGVYEHRKDHHRHLKPNKYPDEI